MEASKNLKASKYLGAWKCFGESQNVGASNNWGGRGYNIWGTGKKLGPQKNWGTQKIPREAPDDKQRRNMNSLTVARSTWSFTVLPTEYPSNIWWYELYSGASSRQTVHGSTDPDTIAYTLVRLSLLGNESSRTSHCFLTWDYHHGKRSFLVTGNRIMEFL